MYLLAICLSLEKYLFTYLPIFLIGLFQVHLLQVL